MDDTLAEYIDTCVTILVISTFIVAFIPFCGLMFSGNFGGFNTQIEKTAVHTSGEIVSHSTTVNPGEVLLSVAIADKYESEPRLINVQGTCIKLGDSTNYSFEANRVSEVRKAYEALDWNKSKGKVILAVGPQGMKEWRYIPNEKN